MEINWVDLGIYLILGFSLFKGYRTGLVRQLLGVIGMFAAVYLALTCYQEFGRILRGFLALNQQIADIVGFGIILFVVFGALNLIGLILSQILGVLFLKPVDRIGGVGLALLKASILIYILLLIIGSIPIEEIHTELQASELALSFLHLVPKAYHSLNRMVPVELPTFIEFENVKGKSSLLAFRIS